MPAKRSPPSQTGDPRTLIGLNHFVRHLQAKQSWRHSLALYREITLNSTRFLVAFPIAVQNSLRNTTNSLSSNDIPFSGQGAPWTENKRKSRPEAYQRRVGRIFDIFTADFLLLNRTGLQHKGFKCKLWRLGHAEGPIVAVMGAQFTSC